MNISNVTTIVDEIIQSVGYDKSRLLDIAHKITDHYGYISDEALKHISQTLSMPLAYLKDQIFFYAFFSNKPKGRFHIRVTQTPISIMKGAKEVMHAFEKTLGIHQDQTTSDGLFYLNWTDDVGMSDQEPSVLINGSVLTNVNPFTVRWIIEKLKKAALQQQSDNQYSPILYPFDSLNPHHLPAPLPQTTLLDFTAMPRGSFLFSPYQNGQALLKILQYSPEAVIETIKQSKLRGRGGAGFLTGTKWESCRNSIGKTHYVVCNADEGEPGTFKDRIILERNPDLVFEGMTIAAYAIGAKEGLFYLRAEYRYFKDKLEKILQKRREDNLLGKSIVGKPGFDFDIRIQLGAGAYICGEESSLIDSLEGKRGSPRDRPPFPTVKGYLEQPTSVNNVETYMAVTQIIDKGVEVFTAYGTDKSSGTKLLSISGDCNKPGVYEVPFGISLNTVLEIVGTNKPAFVQMGGPSGHCLSPKEFGRKIAFEDLATGGSVMIFNEDKDPLQLVLEFARFFAEESCGYCVPCRIGTILIKQDVEKLFSGQATIDQLKEMLSRANTVKETSRCGLGQTAANPFLSTYASFPEKFHALLKKDRDALRIDLHAALAESISIQGQSPIMKEEFND